MVDHTWQYRAVQDSYTSVSSYLKIVQGDAHPFSKHFAVKSHGIPWAISPAGQVMPYWEQTIAPALKEGKTVFVAAHGNSIRAIVKMPLSCARCGDVGYPRAPSHGNG